MTTAILMALRAVFMKLIAGMATEKFIIWVLGFFGEVGVRSTKTTRDDEAFLAILEILDAQKAKDLRAKFNKLDKGEDEHESTSV